MWGMFPSPAIEKRIMIALDDSINPKSGKNILVRHIFTKCATKSNQIRIIGENLWHLSFSSPESNVNALISIYI